MIILPASLQYRNLRGFVRHQILGEVRHHGLIQRPIAQPSTAETSPASRNDFGRMNLVATLPSDRDWIPRYHRPRRHLLQLIAPLMLRPTIPNLTTELYRTCIRQSAQFRSRRLEAHR
jgi:hypothetical protein